MRQCQCGALLQTYELTNSRDVWRCDDCGRRETFDRRTDAEKEEEKAQDRQADLWGAE